MDTRRRTRWAVGPIALAVTACQPSAGRVPRDSYRGEGFCAPPSSAMDGETSLRPLAGVRFDPRLGSVYSVQAQRMAYASGVEALLVAVEDEARATDTAADLRLRALSGRLLERLYLVHVQCAAIVAELDCEGERADQVREAMEHTEGATNQALTVASVTVGGASGIATAVLSRIGGAPDAEAAVAIAGGASSAALGLSIFVVHARRPFVHPRNLLAEVWSGPARSSLFPPVVWYYLTQRELGPEGTRSVRQNLVARWERYEDLTPARGRAVPLLFGRGGVYTVDDLVLRATLIEQTKAAVALMDQQLDQFEHEALARIAAVAAAASR